MDFADEKNDINSNKMFGNEQKTAFLRFNRHGWTKEEIIAYDNVKIKEADEVQEKLLVAEKAYEKGKVDMILGMHEEGFSIPQIAKVSKKTEEEVVQIIENYKNR